MVLDDMIFKCGFCVGDFEEMEGILWFNQVKYFFLIENLSIKHWLFEVNEWEFYED